MTEKREALDQQVRIQELERQPETVDDLTDGEAEAVKGGTTSQIDRLIDRLDRPLDRLG